jgi:hypothetical protein
MRSRIARYRAGSWLAGRRWKQTMLRISQHLWIVPATLLDEQFDEDAGYSERVCAEIRSTGSFARGIDVLPQFINGDYLAHTTPPIKHAYRKSTKAEAAQKEWEKERTDKRARETAEIERQWTLYEERDLLARLIDESTAEDFLAGKSLSQIAQGFGVSGVEHQFFVEGTLRKLAEEVIIPEGADAEFKSIYRAMPTKALLKLASLANWGD